MHKAFLNLFSVIMVAIISCGIFARFGDSRISIFMPILWILISIMLYFIIKNQVVIILYSLFNAFMAGMAMAIYFLKANNFENISVGTALVIVVLLLVNFVVFTSENRYKNVAKWMLLFWAGIGVYGGYIWGTQLSIQGSWIVFVAIIKYATYESGFDIYKIIKLYSMLEFGSVFFLVVAIITEGDALGLIDGVEYKKKKSF